MAINFDWITTIYVIKLKTEFYVVEFINYIAKSADLSVETSSAVLKNYQMLNVHIGNNFINLHHCHSFLITLNPT